MMQITDKYISDLFAMGNFGSTIDNSVEEQRKYLKKSIKHQTEGYWSGSTMHHIMVYGGFIINAKKGSNKQLTALGELLMNEGVNDAT